MLIKKHASFTIAKKLNSREIFQKLSFNHPSSLLFNIIISLSLLQSSRVVSFSHLHAIVVSFYMFTSHSLVVCSRSIAQVSSLALHAFNECDFTFNGSYFYSITSNRAGAGLNGVALLFFGSFVMEPIEQPSLLLSFGCSGSAS